eukprot:15426455-Alexandrium_andersonii.AAC.1
MSASLVGSEMCIRDSAEPLPKSPTLGETWGVKLPAPDAPDAPHLCGARDVVRRHMRHIFVAPQTLSPTP